MKSELCPPNNTSGTKDRMKMTIPFGGDACKQARLHLKKELKEVAERMGLNASALSRYESGRVSMKLEVIVGVAKSLEIDVNSILRDAKRRYGIFLKESFSDVEIVSDVVDALDSD